MYKSCFLGFGSYLPKRVLTNDELSLFLDTDDAWIRKRTGIALRHIADESQSNVDMAYQASVISMKNSSIDPSEIDLIIFATTTPDMVFPSCAVLLQDRLGCKNAAAFDIQAVCSGFLFAMTIADSFIRSGKFKNILIIGSEVMSSIVDWEDRSTAVVFGDGSGAAVMSRSNDNNSFVVDTSISSDGSLSDILKAPGGVRTGKIGKVEMNGRVVFEHAIQKMSNCALELLSMNNFSPDQVDWFVPHQANIRIIDVVAERVGIDPLKVLATIDKHANTSAASIPMALDNFTSSGVIKRNDLILITTVGGGLTWGAALFRY